MYRIATNEAISFINQKPGISSESLQNKTIDNLKSDPYFDEMKFKLNYIKPSQHFPKQQLVFEIF
jgi:RNA polymerase sigma-70 factor (ECF subfamily)